MRSMRLAVLLILFTGCAADAVGGATSSPVTSSRPVAATTDPTTDATTSEPASNDSTLTSLAPRPFGPLPDLAVVSTDGRVAVSRHGAFATPVAGLIAADGSTLISTVSSPGAAGQTTAVTWRSLREGSQQAQITLDGDLTAIATDPSGKVVALTEPNPDSPLGTEIVIATPQGEAFRHAYTTELLPEGFSNIFTGDTEVPAGLFAVEYLDPPPATAGAARRYHVRVLDTATGGLGLPLNLRDKGQTVDEQMLGFGRTHVLSPRNGLLFTLYRGIDADEAGYAFVHTLGFVNGVWCLDLPLDLDLATLPGSVVLTDHENTLDVVSANGFVTEFVIDDITDLDKTPTPRRTVKVWTGGDPNAAPAVAGTDSELVVGQGLDLRWIDAKTLTVTARQSWDMEMQAVALSTNGDAVAAGAGRVSEISPDGQLIAEAPLPDDFDRASSIVLPRRGLTEPTQQD